MTRHMFTGSYLLLVMLIFVLPIQKLQSQDPPQDPPQEQSLHDYTTSTKVSVDFKGGSVTEFVDLVKIQAEAINVLIRSDVQNIELPVLRLRNITAETALTSLIPLSLGALQVELDGESQEYYIIGPNYEREPESVEVVNVAWFLTDASGDVSVEKQQKLLSAIESGQQMLATSSGTMKISLHVETGLLFVKGSPEETRLVQHIVEELLRGLDYHQEDMKKTLEPQPQPDTPTVRESAK